MRKIELNGDIIKLHEMYAEYIVSINHEIEMKKYEMTKLNKKKKNPNKYKQDDFKKAHKEFLNYYIKNIKTISTGCPSELKGIIEHLENYKVLNFMIENKIKFKIICKQEIKERSLKKEFMTYPNLLCEVLGYNKFGEYKYSVQCGEDIKSEEKTKLINRYKEINNAGLSKLKAIETLIDLLYFDFNIRYSTILNAINDNSIIKYWGSYPFAFLINIRACPYCNRQYINPILERNGKMRGDMDHFYPKEKYPYLCLSIYNLIPVCKFCNSSLKGTKDFDSDDLHPYESNLDDRIKFKFDGAGDKIIIKVEKIKQAQGKKVEKYIDYFKLKEQYQYHVEDVKELITKSRIYNDIYIDDIKKLFKLELSTNQLKEYLIGYKIDPNDIHNRPLSKFRRDIVEQLNIEKLRDSNDLSLSLECREKLRQTIKNL